MKTYRVEFEMKGTMSIDVDADSEDEAAEKASNALTSDNIECWDTVGEGTVELLFAHDEE